MTKNRTLAIYGNHLSELDQNHTLEKLGGSLLKTSHSTASYRLFASQDKEAILCEDKSTGRQIRVELWELDAEAMLSLFEQRPTHTYLTNLKLSDGSSHLALLTPLSYCLEQNYEEVSRFGGWERYLLKTAEQAS